MCEWKAKAACIHYINRCARTKTDAKFRFICECKSGFDVVERFASNTFIVQLYGTNTDDALAELSVPKAKNMLNLNAQRKKQIAVACDKQNLKL